jgi:hypothetical protein
MATSTELLAKLDQILGRLTPTMDQYELLKEALETCRARVIKIQAEVAAGYQEIDVQISSLEPMIEICILSGQMKQLMAAQAAKSVATEIKASETTSSD